MPARFNFTSKDYDAESTTHGFAVTELTAANFDAQVALQAAYELALGDMILGEAKKSLMGNYVETDALRSDDPFAQRELKWRVNYRDTSTGKVSHITIGTANTARLSDTKRAYADIGDGAEVDAFVAALEAFMLSDEGHSIEVIDMPLVGRNI
jgi:hypothetical protein